MRWSLSLGRIFGIPIKVHFTFFLLLAFVYLQFTGKGATPAGGLLAVGLVCALFACVVAHEVGHSLTARAFGIRTRSIVLLPIGGVAFLEHIPREPYKEILIAVAGPLVSACLAVLFWLTTGLLKSAPPAQWNELTLGHFPHALALINIVLVAFNLLPAFPMDGGRVLRGLLSLALGWERGTVWAVRLGQTVALCFIVLAISALMGAPAFFGAQNPGVLLLVGLFIFFGAGEEERVVRVRAALAGATVEHAMLRTFATLAPEQPLLDAVKAVVRCNQDEFPVIQDDRIVGLIGRDMVTQAARKRGLALCVGDVMATQFPYTVPAANLDEFYTQIMKTTRALLPVIDEGALVGLISWDQIHRFARLRRQLRDLIPGMTAVPPVSAAAEPADR